MTFLAVAQSTDLLEDAGVRDLVEFYGQEEQARALRRRRVTLADETERWLDLYPKVAAGQTSGVTADDVDRKVGELRAELERLDERIARLDVWAKARRPRRTPSRPPRTPRPPRKPPLPDHHRRTRLPHPRIRPLSRGRGRTRRIRQTRLPLRAAPLPGRLLVRAQGPARHRPHHFVFPEPGIPRPEQEIAANGRADSEAHGQACALLLVQSHSLTNLELKVGFCADGRTAAGV
jgi:hypothetical protein